MREAIRSVLLFPGQGAYRGDTLHSLDQRHLQVRKSFDEIDIVVTRLGGTPIIPQLFDRPAPSTDALISQAPDVLQLAIFGTSMALHNILAANGYQADVLLGHSFGEIAALVAGGAYTVAEGAELVVHRNNVLRAAAPGRMVALSCDVDRARGILDVLGDPWTSIATENGPRQTVVSGPTVAVDAAVAIAAALGIPAAWLPSPYAFHSSLLADLIGPLTERIRHLQARPLTTPVFSSTLGRFYRPDDQVPEQIARALVAPARFARSVAQLADAGASTFVECGGGAALTGLVRKVLPSVTATAGTEWLARLQTEPTKPTIRAASISTIPTAIPTPAHVISTARPAPLPPAVAQSAADPATREALFAELVAMYAEALEYPTEVFTESVSLEADLGIDSVKQTELLARAADRYGLPEAQPEGFRLSDLDTMGKVVNYLWSMSTAVGSPVVTDVRAVAA